MVCCIMATSTLSAILIHFADAPGMYPPELQLYCCHTRLQCLTDGAVHDIDYLPDLVTHGIAQTHTSKLTMQTPVLISNCMDLHCRQC
jgi:hypothetical protein